MPRSSRVTKVTRPRARPGRECNFIRREGRVKCFAFFYILLTTQHHKVVCAAFRTLCPKKIAKKTLEWKSKKKKKIKSIAYNVDTFVKCEFFIGSHMLHICSSFGRTSCIRLLLCFLDVCVVMLDRSLFFFFFSHVALKKQQLSRNCRTTQLLWNCLRIIDWLSTCQSVLISFSHAGF